MNLIEFIQEIRNNHVIGVVGDLGDGKTITGVFLSILLNLLYSKFEPEQSLLTNVPVTVKHEYLEFYSQLEERKNTIIFMDELHQTADCRTSMKGSNFFTSGITMDVRKFKNKFIWTSQESGQVEKRVRNRTLLYLKPRKIFNLVFEISMHDIKDYGYDSIKLNLDGFKNLYDTHYKPFPLIRDEEE
jgi:hypothetical protein